MKRFLGNTIAVAVLVCILLDACPALFASVCVAEPLKVGVIAPLTGPASPYGSAVKNGLELYVKEHPGGLVNYVVEDDQFSSTRTVAAFHKLVDVDGVDALISVGSTSTAAIAPLVQERGIPLLGWVSDDRISKGRSWIMRSYMSGFEEGYEAANEALRRGYKSVGVAVSSSDYSASVKNGFLRGFPGDRVLLNEEFLPEEMDYRTLIARIRSLALDGVYLCINPGPQSVLARQIKQAGLRPHIFGCESLNNMDEVKASAGGLDGAWFVAAGVTKEFKKRYIGVYGNDNVISGAAVHYDLAGLLDEFSRTHDTPSQLIQFLIGVGPRNGAVGPYQPVRENEDQFLRMKLAITEIGPEGFRD